MLITLQALCVVWKTAQVSVSLWHIPEKKITKSQIKKSGHGTAGISKVGLGNNCPIPNVSGIV